MSGIPEGTLAAVNDLVVRARRMDDVERELLHKEWLNNIADWRRRQIRVAYKFCRSLADDDLDQLGEHLQVRADAYAAAHQPGSPWWGAPAAVADAVFAVLAGRQLSEGEWWMFAGPYRSLFPEVSLSYHGEVVW